MAVPVVRFRRTALAASVTGWGTAPLGSVSGAAAEAQAVDTVRAALGSGGAPVPA